MFRRFNSILLSSSSSSSKRPITTLDIHAAYRVLNLPSGASTDQARQQYLRLARQFHPDLTNGDDTKMKSINLAYEVVQQHGPVVGSNTGAGGGSKAAAARSSKRGGNVDETDDGFGDETEMDQQFSGGRSSASSKFSSRRVHRPTSPLGDTAKWNSRPEFEWRAAIFDVNEQERANPRNNAHTFNRQFSFADDAAIFRAVRAGADVAEVGRTLGRTPVSVEARMNSVQFKLRIQKLLKSGGGVSAEDAQGKSPSKMNAKHGAARQVHPHLDTVYRTPQWQRREVRQGDLPFLHPEEVGAGEDSSQDEFSTRGIASAQGRSYAHLKKHMARRKMF